MRVQRVSLAGIIVIALTASGAVAQEHQHPPATQTAAPADQHDHSGAASLFSAREGSGTSWLPTNSDMYAVHSRAGQWELMWHGNAYLQFLHESANEHRGSTQTGSINWLMGMARRSTIPHRRLHRDLPVARTDKYGQPNDQSPDVVSPLRRALDDVSGGVPDAGRFAGVQQRRHGEVEGDELDDGNIP